jgi:hypothetical protein
MTEETSEAVGRWMERYRLQFIGAMALLGLLITLVSFAPWVEFRSVDAEGVTPTAPKAEVTVSGTSLSRWRDEENLLGHDVQEVDGWCSCHVAAGDGYLTALLGIVIVIAAAGAFVLGADRPMAMGGVAASLATFVVAGYNALGEWNAYVWTRLQNLEVTEGVIQPALYILVAASIAAAVASGLLWGAGAEEAHEQIQEDEEDDSDDVPTGLALRLMTANPNQKG